MKYLAGRNGQRGVEVSGTVEAADVVEATKLARKRWGDVGVMPPAAVSKWMRRGPALNEDFQRRAGER